MTRGKQGGRVGLKIADKKTMRARLLISRELDFPEIFVIKDGYNSPDG
jgi:hypothetical protein